MLLSREVETKDFTHTGTQDLHLYVINILATR
jgi:hypothetical protein